MRVLFLYVWNFWCYFSMSVVFIISAIIGLLLSFFSDKLFSYFVFFLAKLIVFLLGVKTKIYGDYPLEDNDSYIYIANHSSYLDPVFTTYLIKKQT